MRWLARSREHTNFTYHLTPLNRRYLAHFLAVVCKQPPQQMLCYLDELQDDARLIPHVLARRSRSQRRFLADPEVRLGRRIGWYAMVRALRPRLVVEAGVDKGLGACVLCAALLRNRLEGHPGAYVGLDLNPRAGYLLAPPYSDVGRLVVGDSVRTLDTFEKEIDLFVSDSDHSPSYETREFDAVEPRLSKRAYVLGDNAHASANLIDFAQRTGRAFLYFREEPDDHWYPGGGIGVAYPALDGVSGETAASTPAVPPPPEVEGGQPAL